MRLPLRQFFRLAALFVILIVLLTCYQFLGNAMLSTFYPRDEPAVWISLNTQLPAADSASNRIPEVGQPDAEFTVVTPPDRQIIFSVNRSVVERRQSALDPAVFHASLREGLNDIWAGIADSRGSRTTESGHMQVVYRPERPPKPVLLTEPYLDDQKSLIFTVFAPPDSGSDRHVTAGGMDRWIDGLAGVTFVAVRPGNEPAYMFLSERQGASRLQVWPLPVRLAPSTPASSMPPVPFVVVHDRVKRQTHFTLDKDGYLSIEAHFAAPKEALLFEWVEKGEISPAEFFNDVLNLSFEPWFKKNSVLNQTFDEMAPFLAWDASFTRDLIPTSPIDSSIHIENDQIVLHAKARIPKTGLQISARLPWGSQFASADQVTITVANRGNVDLAAPATWNGNSAELALADLKEGRPLMVVHPIEDPVPDPDAGDSANSGEENEQAPYFVLDYFRSVQDIVPRNFRAVLTALIGAIPFIWALALIGKGRLPGDVAKQLSAACVVFLILHFTIRSLEILTVSLRSLHLAQLFKKPEFEWSLSRLGSYYPFLAVAVIILLRPIFNAYRGMELSRKKSLWRTAGRAIVLVASLLICVGIAVFLQFGSKWMVMKGFPAGARAKVLLGVAAACALFWVPLRSAIVSLLGIPVSRRPVFLANFAIISLATVPPLLDFAFRRSISSYLAAFHAYPFFLPWPAVGPWLRWIVAILGAVLLFQVIRLAIRISSWREGIQFVNARQGRWLFVPLMIAAIPAWYAKAATRPGEVPGLYDFSNFAYRLDDLLPYAILPAIILLMRRLNRKDEYLISPALMSAGCLLFAYYLCGQSITVLFIPVPMLLGYFLFRYFLIGPAAESRPPDVSVGLAAFLQMRSRESIGRERKKAIEKKFQQGELSPLEFNRGISQVDDFVKSAIDDYSSVRSSQRMDAFALGPESGPWRSAMTSVKYGLIISIPFQLFALAKTLHRPAGDFPVIYLALSVIQSLALWTVVSFLFGYFFHAMRGGNGFQKALSFLVALSLPTILLQLMITSATLDTVQLLQLVQLAAFVLLLALVVFDLRLLKHHGFSWRDLPAAYGVTTSAAYLGTVALSLVSAVIEPAIHDWVIHLLKLK